MHYKKTSNTAYLPALTVVVLLLAGHWGFSQERIKIRLHDFTLFQGPIFHSFDSAGVNLLIDNTIAFISYDKIRTIRLYEWDAKVRASLSEKLPGFKQFEKGYYHSAGLAPLFGKYYTGISLSMVNGYQFHPMVGAGLVVSYDRYENLAFVPVSLELKAFVKKGKFIPFYFVRPGYGFLVESLDGEFEEVDNHGGISWQGGVGYQVNFFETAMAFSIAYTGQNASLHYTFPAWWGPGPQLTEVSEKRGIRRIGFKMEIIF